MKRSNGMSAIRTVGLGKRFGDVWAVRDLNLQVREGEIYGFVGPNGAGKSTTILMILAILQPSEGGICLFGNHVNGSLIEHRLRIGMVSEKQYLYSEMTIREYLDFFGELYRVADRKDRIEDLAERVELVHALDRRLGALSRGMQQKVGLLRALLHSPDLLILDEPISGLDPGGIHQVRELIEEENRRGKTVLISSHQLSEVEKLCNRVGILNNGRLVAEDQMRNLLDRLAEWSELFVELSEEWSQASEALEGLDFVRDIRSEGKLLKIKVRTDQDYRQLVVQSLISQGQIPVRIEAKSMSLEEAFLTITKDHVSLLEETD
jgi:ABC-type multidrug transport system ATPase subunit